MFDSFKNLAQIGQMMPKIKEMQTKMAQAQQRLPTLKASATSEGGFVSATANGLLQIVSLDIMDAAVLQGGTRLSALIQETVNAALQNAQSMIQQEMQNAAASSGVDPELLKNMQNSLGN